MPLPRRTREQTLEHILANSIPTAAGCLIWQKSTDRDGYGHIRFDGKNNRTHRVAWILQRGPIPDGMCICHRCDTPSCNNVEHYWLGTSAENTRDRDLKKRGRDRDENRASGKAQFASIEARAQMSRAKGGRPFRDQFGRVYQTHNEAAKALDTSQACVWRVLAGRRPSTKGFVFSYLEKT